MFEEMTTVIKIRNEGIDILKKFVVDVACDREEVKESAEICSREFYDIEHEIVKLMFVR